MLNFRKGTLQDELLQYAEALHGDDSTAPVTPAALCKARKKLKYELFTDLNHVAVKHFSNHFTLQRWHGFRLLAVDGSTGRLPNTKEITQTFGGPSDASCPMARFSRLYDVMNKVIVRADIESYVTGEREMAATALYDTLPDDLLLYDRGYPAFWLLAMHRDLSRHYCMRVPVTFNREVKEFIKSGQRSRLIMLTPNDDAIRQCQEYNLSFEPLMARLVRVKLQNGEVEVLITSLLDEEQYPSTWFKQLYQMRWGVEEGYKREKSRVEIENFSGRSALTVQQDFHAKILALNLASMTAWVAQAIADQRYRHRRLRYQVNFANALSLMKNRLVRLLLGANPIELCNYLTRQMAAIVEPIRPDRSYPRNIRSQKLQGFHGCYKRTR